MNNKCSLHFLSNKLRYSRRWPSAHVNLVNFYFFFFSTVSTKFVDITINWCGLKELSSFLKVFVVNMLHG